MKNIVLAYIVIIFMSAPVLSQDNIDKGMNMITREALKAQLGFLASDWTEGRETGEKGAFMSADYIASMLQLFGTTPGGDMVSVYDPQTRTMKKERSYFQSFALQKISAGPEQYLSVIMEDGNTKRSVDFNYLSDFTISPTYPGGTTEADVVFVGYGNDEESYGKLSVKGKFIIRLGGLPANSENSSDPYSSYRIRIAKDRIAIEKGAAGIIEVDADDNGMQWTEDRDFMDLSPSERRRYGPGQRYRIPDISGIQQPAKITVSKKVANTILSETGKNIDEMVKEGNFKPFTLNDTRIKLRTTIISDYVHVRNVIGMIEGIKKDEFIVLGAHYDHTGMSEGYIYNGADDNGSGTVGVMTLARAIRANGIKPEKSIMFALWTGEEKGLLGSRYFADNPTIPLENIVLNVNFDMISRYVSDDQPNKVTMTYTDSYPYFREITEKHLDEYKIDLNPDYQPSDNPPGGSDHRSFVAKGIPVLRFKPGHREEYHTPEDEVSTIDWDIMEKIIKISYLNIWDLANTNW